MAGNGLDAAGAWVSGAVGGIVSAAADVAAEVGYLLGSAVGMPPGDGRALAPEEACALVAAFALGAALTAWGACEIRNGRDPAKEGRPVQPWVKLAAGMLSFAAASLLWASARGL